MLNFYETRFLKRFMPIAKVSLLVFACKSKMLESHGCNRLNCRNQPNICKFLLGLEALILDNCFLIWCRKMWIKNVQHTLRTLGFASRSTPFRHPHFIIHPAFIILCFSDVKRVCLSHNSSCIFRLFIHWDVNIFMWAVYIAKWSCNSGWLLLTLLGLFICFIFTHPDS